MVFCAEITITGSPGAFLADARQRLQPVAIGHHHIGDHQIALPLLNPAHQRVERGRGMDLTPRPRQRLRQHRADRAVVVSYKDSAIHQFVSSDLGATGREIRKHVRPGLESTETHPPCSEIILDTSARPSPVPFSRPETKARTARQQFPAGCRGRNRSLRSARQRAGFAIRAAHP